MILLLLSIVLYSVNNVLWKRNLEGISVSFLMAYRSFFTSLIAAGILFFHYRQYLSSIDFITFSKISSGSLLGVLGLFSMLKVLQNNSLKWLGIYNLIGVFVTSTYLFLFEEIDVIHSLIGLVIILVGFSFFLLNNQKTSLKIGIQQHALLWIMTLSFSISGIIHWRNLKGEIPPMLILSNQELFVFSTALLVTFWRRKPSTIKPWLKLYFGRVFLMSLIIFMAVLLGFLGLKTTNPLISSLLFLASPLMTIVFSSIFYKEKITLNNSLAIAIICLGAFVLHYYQS
jgi:drug/metabolite transporter (DMT)-like permease